MTLINVDIDGVTNSHHTCPMTPVAFLFSRPSAAGAGLHTLGLGYFPKQLQVLLHALHTLGIDDRGKLICKVIDQVVVLVKAGVGLHGQHAEGAPAACGFGFA